MLAVKHAGWLIPCVIVIMPLAHFSVQDWCEPVRASFAETVNPSRVAELIFVAPLVIFPITVAEGLLLLFLSQKTARGASVSWFMKLVISSALSTTLFYVTDEIFGRCEVKSIFDRALHPNHYVMWAVTMHIDSQTLHMLALAQSVKARAEADVVARERKLVQVFLLTQVLFFTAYFANYMLPLTAINVALLVLSFLCLTLIIRENYVVIQALRLEHGTLAASAAKQLFFIITAISVKWAYYTVVWMLSSVELIGMTTERAVLSVLDILKAGFAISAWAFCL